MDTLTINRAQSPAFTQIKYQNGLLNNKTRKELSRFITNKLNEVDTSDRAKRSFVQRAEDYGYNILFSQGKRRKSVRVDIVSALAEEKAAVWNGTPINDRSLIGTYSKPEEFNIDHFNKKYKPEEKTTRNIERFFNGMLITLSTIAAIAVGSLIFGKGHPSDSHKMRKVELVAKDSTKIDSIKPFIEDTIKTAKKIIKK